MKQYLERGQAIEGTVLSSVQRQKLHPAAGKYADNPSLKSHNPGAFESRLLWRRFEFDCEVP